MISKKTQLFSQIRSSFFMKLKKRVLNVLRVFTVSVAFFGNFATFSKSPKTEKRIRKPVSVSQKTQDLNVFRSPAVSVAFYSNLLHLPSFEKLKKIHTCLFQRNQNMNVLRNLTFSKRIPFQFCYLQHFEKKWSFIFEKSVFFEEKTNFAGFEKFYFFSRLVREICNIQHI